MHHEALERISQIEGVKEVIMVTGKYDAVVEIEAPTVGDILSILQFASSKMKEVEDLDSLIELPPD